MIHLQLKMDQQVFQINLNQLTKMSIIKVTEQDSLYNNLENLSTTELINSIHNEDKKICSAIQKVLPLISKLVRLGQK